MNKGTVIKNGTEGVEGISKFAVKLCRPIQETATVDIAPKHFHKLFSDPWLQYKLPCSEAASRKIVSSLQLDFLPMHHAVNTVFMGSGIRFNKTGRTCKCQNSKT